MKNSTPTDPSVLASKFINQTNKSVFLTGKAGTGKTTFLKAIIDKTHKKAVVVAPTGIAAINAGGVTIHSQFQLPFGAFLPTNATVPNHLSTVVNNIQTLKANLIMSVAKRQTLKAMELLIIDEVSMLRADVLDAMDTVLRFVRGDYNAPFGGVQVLFIGDLMQLPPVVKNEEWDILKEHYAGIFFFHAKVLQEEQPQYIELEKIYRQSDVEFIKILDNLRNNRIEKADLEVLNRYHIPNFVPTEKDNYITLTTHNARAAQQNQTALEALTDKAFTFKAEIEGEFPTFSYPTDNALILKKGAQIIFIKNDPTGRQRFFNGKIAIVESISGEDIEVRFKGENEKIVLEKYEWKNQKYTVNDDTKEINEETIGTFVQYPIKLAWAITVHKSQGLTFERAVLDINSAFAPGQVYVALSRLKSLDGLVLTTKFNLNVIQSDAQVIRFASSKKEMDEMNGILEIEIFMFLKDFLYKTFNINYPINAWQRHVDTYNKSEKNSEKQKHTAWAIEQYETLDAEKKHAEAFIKQLENTLETATPNLIFALKRLEAAEKYFAEIFKTVLLNIRKHREKMRSLTKTKTYVEELSELEMVIQERLVSFRKAVVLLEGVLNGEEITKKHFQAGQFTEGVSNLLRQISESAIAETPKKAPKMVGETYALTLKAHKEGKNALEIARERSISLGTVFSHYNTLLKKGEINIESLIEESRLAEMIYAFREFDGKTIMPIKEKLGDDFSYDEIRLVKTYWEALNEESIF